jgi:cytidine deaminase
MCLHLALGLLLDNAMLSHLRPNATQKYTSRIRTGDHCERTFYASVLQAYSFVLQSWQEIITPCGCCDNVSIATVVRNHHTLWLLWLQYATVVRNHHTLWLLWRQCCNRGKKSSHPVVTVTSVLQPWQEIITPCGCCDVSIATVARNHHTLWLLWRQYCNRGNKSSHPVVAVTMSVIYAGTRIAVATSWFYVSVSLHVKRSAIILWRLYFQ